MKSLSKEKKAGYEACCHSCAVKALKPGTSVIIRPQSTPQRTSRRSLFRGHESQLFDKGVDIADRVVLKRDIEGVKNKLAAIEQHQRNIPGPVHNANLIGVHHRAPGIAEWRQRVAEYQPSDFGSDYTPPTILSLADPSLSNSELHRGPRSIAETVSSTRSGRSRASDISSRSNRSDRSELPPYVRAVIPIAPAPNIRPIAPAPPRNLVDKLEQIKPRRREGEAGGAPMSGIPQAINDPRPGSGRASGSSRR